MTLYSKIRIAVSAVILAAFALCLALSAFPRLDAMATDMLLSSGGTAAPEIIIIAIDEDSIKALGSFPFPRSAYATLLDNLTEGGAAVVAMDILFTEESGEYEDEALMEAIAYAGNVILPVQINIRVGQETEIGGDGVLVSHGVIEPIPMLAAQTLDMGHINALLDDWDSFLRHGMVTFRDAGDGTLVRSWDEAIYSWYCEITGRDPDSKQSRKYSSLPLVHYAGPPGTITHYPFFAALDPDIIDPSEFEGKIVLIGAYASSLAEDAYFTPASGTQRMYGVEYHANVISNMLSGEFVYSAPVWLNLIALALFCGATIVCYRLLRRTIIKLCVFICAIAVYAAGWYFLMCSGWAFSVSYALIALLLIYLSDVVISYAEEFADKRRISNIFGRYLAPQVLDKLIREGEDSLKLGGEERELTVLFVDIRGFTPMSEMLRPIEVVEILNEYLTLATDAVFEYGGTLDKYIGDAAMALYNVPFEQDNHALRAVKSALYMQRHGEAMSEALTARFGRGVQFGVGINTGRAVVGNIGSPTRMDFTAIGDTINVAARLESNAKAGQILISDAVYELVKDEINAEPLGGLKVKGRECEVSAYLVIGTREEGLQPERSDDMIAAAGHI